MVTRLEHAENLLRSVLAHFSWVEAYEDAYDEFAPSQLTCDTQRSELTELIKRFLSGATE